MVQKILSSMDSDDVNDISDTEEALQVVDIIEDTYNFLIVQIDPKNLDKTCQLTNFGDVTKPTHLAIPEDITEIGKIKYEITATGDTNRSFRDLRYLEPQDFIDKLLVRSSGDANVQEVTSPDNTPLFIFNDQPPTWWTSFDDENVVADAFDSAEESTLNGSNTITLCTVLPSFTKSNTFIPDLPEKAFPLFLAESKKASHLYLKQQTSIIDEKRSVQGNHTFRNKREVAHDSKRKIQYGRKRHH